MPIRKVFVDGEGDQFSINEDNCVVWMSKKKKQTCILLDYDIPEFIEWLTAEAKRCGILEADQPEVEETAIDPNDYPVDEWIKYTGDGECPVPGNWELDVKLRMGHITEGWDADCFRWAQDGLPNNITHFKIISKD